jgi:aminoglycoside phosphotransferase (APT) family kinase protein
MSADPFALKLQRATERLFGEGHPISGLERLTAGASREIWRFDAVSSSGHKVPLILRRSDLPSSEEVAAMQGFALEATLLERAGANGTPVPLVYGQLEAHDDLGAGLFMARIEGETLPQRILREARFDGVRPLLARQCGEILAKLHRVPAADLAQLPVQPAGEQVARYGAEYRKHGEPRPVFEWALRWLKDEMPPETPNVCLVHGDFRHGNLIIGTEGVRAVLDWELAHLGDPMEDLGWICVNSWRFGSIDKPVGGFGQREELYAGYESAGGHVDRARVKYWEVLGTLKWGVMCQMMAASSGTNSQQALERAAIGRRSSETEIDLLDLLAPEGLRHA